MNELQSLVDSEVESELTAYLTGGQTLRDFQRGFLPVAWSLGHEDSQRHPLARSVELRLAEYTNGHWSETELRAQLALLVAGTTASTGFKGSNPWHGSYQVGDEEATRVPAGA